MALICKDFRVYEIYEGINLTWCLGLDPYLALIALGTFRQRAREHQLGDTSIEARSSVVERVNHDQCSGSMSSVVPEYTLSNPPVKCLRKVEGDDKETGEICGQISTPASLAVTRRVRQGVDRHGVPRTTDDPNKYLVIKSKQRKCPACDKAHSAWELDASLPAEVLQKAREVLGEDRVVPNPPALLTSTAPGGVPGMPPATQGTSISLPGMSGGYSGLFSGGSGNGLQFPTLPTSFLQNDTTQQNNATQQLLKQLVDCHTETNKKIDQIIEVLKCNAQGGASEGGQPSSPAPTPRRRSNRGTS